MGLNNKTWVGSGAEHDYKLWSSNKYGIKYKPANMAKTDLNSTIISNISQVFSDPISATSIKYCLHILNNSINVNFKDSPTPNNWGNANYKAQN